MYIRFIFYFGSANERNVRVNSVPIADLRVMTDNGVGLDEITFTDTYIRSQCRKGSDYGSFTYLYIGSNTGGTMNHS